MKKLFFLAAMCCMSLLAMAEAGPICDYLLGTGTDHAYVKWVTDADGNVDITIFPYNKSAETDPAKLTGWRGRGMADDLTAAKGWAMTIDGVDAVLADYFDKNYTAPANQAAHTTVYQLKIKDGMKAQLDGHTVTITKTTAGSNICWFTPGNNNAYAKYTMEYLYGSTCVETTIGVPQNVAINGNMLTFDAVEGAESYSANIYYGTSLVKSVDVVPTGTELLRLMLTGATFQVKVVAKAGSVESDPSAAVDWVVASQPLATVGASEYCEEAIGTGASLAGMTWQTADNGDVVISISGEEAAWRGTAFKGMDYFQVGSIPASAFFEELYTTGATTYTLHLKDAAVRPVVGEEITFKGTPQWKTAGAGNAYVENVVYTYTYTSVCISLDAPQNVAVSADSVLTFDAVTGATSYAATIYLNGLPVGSFNDVHSGDVLHYNPLVDGTYNVTVYAMAEGAMNSAESAPFAWVLTGKPWTPVQSTFCALEFISDTYEGNPQSIDSSRVTISMITRNDSIIATIRPVIANDTVSFRGNDAFKLTSFRVNGVSAANYFTTNSKDKDTLYVLVPKSGVTLPHGSVVEFTGSIPWRTRWNTNAYKENYSFSYVYGSSCEELTPVVPPTPTEEFDYIQVTAAPASWEGEYVIAAVVDGVALAWTGIDAGQCKDSVAVTNYLLAEGTYTTVTVAAMADDSGYSVMVNGGANDGKYISSGTSAPGYSNGLKFIATATRVDFAFNNGVVEMSQTIVGGTNDGKKMYLLYNSNSGDANERYRFYKDTNLSSSSYKTPCLFKKTAKGDVPTAIETIDAEKVVKFFRGGQLYIQKGDAVYTISGVRVE